MQDLHNDYPLAPEKLEISQNMLSNYCFNFAHKYGIKIGEVNKLVLNLGNKCKYVINYRNIQLYSPLAMKLTTIHRVLKFKQSDWLKTFIDFNTDKRKNAVNNFEKKNFKPIIDILFGKTMKNLRNRASLELINNSKDYVTSITKPSFVSEKICSKSFIVIHKIKPVLALNKPISVGFSILDLSKWFVYNFHYKYVKNKFYAKLLVTVTDSLAY